MTTRLALRVGLIAPPAVPVPPPRYGGTELVVDELARGLEAAGCSVVLYTTGDSTCPVPRRWRHPRATGTLARFATELEHVDQAYRDLDDVDLIHDHTLLGPLLAMGDPPAVPVVATVHGTIDGRLAPYFERVGSKVPLVCISHAQRATAPKVPVAAVIHHGIDVASYPVGEGRGGYVVFLGRMCEEKGPDRAIRIARRAGRRIVVAAKMREPEEQAYFAEHVAPLLGPEATYVGEVGGDEKRRLLADAEVLLNPIHWPEPFGLVMVEALASGTPVLAFASGSSPEIVDDGRTGFLCEDEDEMVRRLDLIGSIDRRACRADAARRFSTTRMVADHVALYEQLLDGRPTRELAAVGVHYRPQLPQV